MAFSKDNELLSQNAFGRFISDVAQSSAEVEADDLREIFGSSVGNRTNGEFRQEVIDWVTRFPKRQNQ